MKKTPKHVSPVKWKSHVKNQLVLSTCKKHQKMLPMFLLHGLQILIKRKPYNTLEGNKLNKVYLWESAHHLWVSRLWHLSGLCDPEHHDQPNMHVQKLA